MNYSFCIVLHVAADGATTPGNSGSQKEAGVRFKADCNLGKSLVNYNCYYWLRINFSFEMLTFYMYIFI